MASSCRPSLTSEAAHRTGLSQLVLEPFVSETPVVVAPHDRVRVQNSWPEPVSRCASIGRVLRLT